jgi:nucleotide-binding universal stress UspA family protein
MKRILVPCDFSKPAIEAFRYALDVADQSNGFIHLLYVVQLPVMHDTMLMPTLNFEEQYLKDAEEASKKHFEKIIAKYNKQNIEVTFTVRFGSPSTTILEFTQENVIDVVIMGSHGASGFRELVIGSNAEKIVRRSPVPVLIIKDYVKSQVKNIVFPNDLDTEQQEDFVMKVKALQHFFKAHLHIVWINTPLNFTNDTETIDRLTRFAKRYMLKNYTIHVFNHSNEESGILEYSKYIKADLIAMATHGRKGLSHFFNGSLAEDVANHATCPIWTYTLKNEPVEA